MRGGKSPRFSSFADLFSFLHHYRSQPVEAGRAARSSKAVQTSRFTKSRKSVQASKLVKPNRSIESSRVFQPGRPVQSGNGGQPSDVVDDNELTDSHGELSNDEIDDVRGLPSPGPSQVNRESYGSVKQDSNEESVASDTTGRRLTQLITDIQPGSDELEDLYQKPSNEGNVAQNVPSRRSSQVSRVSRATSWRDSDQESIASNATSHRLSRLATDEGLSDGEEIVRDAPKRRRKVISKAHCSGAFFDSYEKIDAREMPKRRPSILRRVLHAGGRRSSDEEGVATAAMPRRRPSIIHKVTSSAYSMGSNLANLMHNNRSTDSSMESFTCIDASQQEARAAAAIPPRRPNRPLSTVSEGSRE